MMSFSDMLMPIACSASRSWSTVRPCPSWFSALYTFSSSASSSGDSDSFFLRSSSSFSFASLRSRYLPYSAQIELIGPNESVSVPILRHSSSFSFITR